MEMSVQKNVLLTNQIDDEVKNEVVYLFRFRMEDLDDGFRLKPNCYRERD